MAADKHTCLVNKHDNTVDKTRLPAWLFCRDGGQLSESLPFRDKGQSSLMPFKLRVDCDLEKRTGAVPWKGAAGRGGKKTSERRGTEGILL